MSQSSEASGYSSSHRGEEKAIGYETTYSRGYYANEWIWEEQPLVRQTFLGLQKSGCTTLTDFACGTGRITAVAEDYFDVVQGVDISPEMLALAARNCQAATFSLSTERVIEDESQDVVSAFRFFLNAEDELRSESMGRISRWIRPGGYFLANTHAQPLSPLGLTNEARHLVGGSARSLSVRSLTHLIEDNGLSVEKVTHYGLFPRMGSFYPSIVNEFHKLFVGKRTPRLIQPFAQSALVLARKPE